jgi:Fe-S-cluster containining protein
MRKAAKSIDCPYITAEHRCEVYELRPLICRLMGVVGKMLCPYSRAEIILTKEEEDAIHKAYSEVFNQ